ncbi:hypothetical protein BDP55DRAFT_753220 [Colletotrichum godetiae]|uniref:Uncharacterized protein n=1 Tax=Colletotrichum godetiae TaxID=1209918 RepID=A0AAJ0ETF4_9PEZI|nr:uncharacterized protein BDP55DRAFT_753220 [Colletotrichum godetiae]KAK1671184.1 hypothetical protein BDP55DRAFT_753220 [Colletotrichum godetiae]
MVIATFMPSIRHHHRLPCITTCCFTMVRQNQKRKKDNPETRISGFWLQRSGSLLACACASLSCRFFKALISAGSDPERFIPRLSFSCLDGRRRCALLTSLHRAWLTSRRSGTFVGGGTASSQALAVRSTLPHGTHMGTIGPNPVAWNIDMAGWIRHPRMDVHIPHRPSPIAHRPSQTVPLPACSQPGTHEASNHLEQQGPSGYAMAATSSARGSHAKSSPADGAHLHHHLPYRQRAARSLQSSLFLGSPTGMTRNAVLFRLVPGTGGKSCWLAALFSYAYSSSIWPRSLLLPLEFSADPLTAVPRMASQVPSRVAKVLRRRYDTARPTDTCPGTGDRIPAANNSNIEAWYRDRTGFRVRSAISQLRPAEPLKFLLAPASSQAPNWVAFGLDHCETKHENSGPVIRSRQHSSFLLLLGSPLGFTTNAYLSTVRCPRPVFGTTWPDQHTGLVWLGMASAAWHAQSSFHPFTRSGHTIKYGYAHWKYGHCGCRCYPAVLNAAFILMMGKSGVGLERARKDIHDGEQQRDSESVGHDGYGALMPHDKQMLDACEDRDPTSIGDVLPLELPSVVWHIHEEVQRAACGTGMIATGPDKRPKYSLPPSPGNKKREQRPCVPKNPRTGFGCAATSSTMAPPGVVVAERWLCPSVVALQYVGIPYFQGWQAADAESEGKDAGVGRCTYTRHSRMKQQRRCFD